MMPRPKLVVAGSSGGQEMCTEAESRGGEIQSPTRPLRTSFMASYLFSSHS